MCKAFDTDLLSQKTVSISIKQKNVKGGSNLENKSVRLLTICLIFLKKTWKWLSCKTLENGLNIVDVEIFECPLRKKLLKSNLFCDIRRCPDISHWKHSAGKWKGIFQLKTNVFLVKVKFSLHIYTAPITRRSTIISGWKWDKIWRKSTSNLIFTKCCD